MILRAHRASTALLCWRKAFNRFHRGYDRDMDWNLRVGAAVHAGVAIGRSTNDWTAAVDGAEEHVRANFQLLGLPGEDYEVTQHVKVVRICVERYAEVWARLTNEVRVIAPEMEFHVPLPNSEHFCVFKQWVNMANGKLHTDDPPTADDILRGNVEPGLIRDNHWLDGRSDALIEWNGRYWVDEFKTTSIWGDKFWNEYFLDQQLTIYLYGVWKATGIMPAGAIIHGFYKPSESQVKEWSSRRTDPTTAKPLTDYIKYDRQLFTREPRDLERIESQMVQLANEWEARVQRGTILSGQFPMSNVKGVCTQFNRQCEFHQACLQHDESGFDRLTKVDPEKNRLYNIEGAK